MRRKVRTTPSVDIPKMRAEDDAGGSVAIPADEKRRPLAVVFYDGERDKLNFDRLNGVELEEFAAIMARLFPRWLERDFPTLREMLRNSS